MGMYRIQAITTQIHRGQQLGHVFSGPETITIVTQPVLARANINPGEPYGNSPDA
jgi:hypothetical protein